MKRCKWCNLNNPLYIEYHDNEWGVLKTDDHYLFEMLILESFQAGLSWECILNKRKAFREAYDNFDIDKICNYNEDKINELINNKKIVRNKLKIKSVNNFCDYHSGEEISGELLRKYTEETHTESKDKNISFDSTSD